ncbi:hypothetical protein ES703_82090 [subsurface metagenome]
MVDDNWILKRILKARELPSLVTLYYHDWIGIEEPNCVSSQFSGQYFIL